MLSSALTPSMLEFTFYAFGSARIVDGGTQSMPLSAAIKNGIRRQPKALMVHSSIVLPASTTNFAFGPLAQR